MTDDLDKLWLAWARKRWWDVTDAMCKFRFELQESLRRMPTDQRKRLTQEAADLDCELQDPDLLRFRRMLYGWTYGNSQDFRQKTLASLNCDPDAWKRGSES